MKETAGAKDLCTAEHTYTDSKVRTTSVRLTSLICESTFAKNGNQRVVTKFLVAIAPQGRNLVPCSKDIWSVEPDVQILSKLSGFSCNALQRLQLDGNRSVSEREHVEQDRLCYSTTR